ncbi:MAG: hypothetical protein MN733_09600, partial [Nitrososphaera sp.]|nr:hypothetical protein [Nitrososphaera sp.]
MKLTRSKKVLIALVLLTCLLAVLSYLPFLAPKLRVSLYGYFWSISLITALASMSYLAQIPEDSMGLPFFPAAMALIGLGSGLMIFSIPVSFLTGTVGSFTLHTLVGIGIGSRFPRRWFLAGLLVCLIGMFEYVGIIVEDAATGTDPIEVGFVGKHYFNFVALMISAGVAGIISCCWKRRAIDTKSLIFVLGGVVLLTIPFWGEDTRVGVKGGKPFPTIPGPEATDLVARVTGYLVVDHPVGGIDALSLPDLTRITILRSLTPAEFHRGPLVRIGGGLRKLQKTPVVWNLSGPDQSGRIAYIDRMEDYSRGYRLIRYRLNTISVDGRNGQTVFTRHDYIPDHVEDTRDIGETFEPGESFVLSHTEGLVALVRKEEYRYH